MVGGKHWVPPTGGGAGGGRRKEEEEEEEGGGGGGPSLLSYLGDGEVLLETHCPSIGTSTIGSIYHKQPDQQNQKKEKGSSSH